MSQKSYGTIKSYLDWADKGRSSWWIYLIGAVLGGALITVIGGFVTVPLNMFFPNITDTPTGSLFFATMSFLLAFLGVPLLTWLLHARPWWSVALPRPHISWWALIVGFIAAFIEVFVLIFFYGLSGFSQLSFHIPEIGPFLSIFAVGFVMFFIQVTAEELFYRGYLAQFIYRFIPSPIAILLITALLFALPHLNNLSSMQGEWYAILPYVISGLLLAWLAYRFGSLWLAIGFHFGNNFTLSTFAGFAKGSDVISTSTDFITVTMPPTWVLIAANAVMATIMALVLTWLIKRREEKTGQKAV